MRTKAEKPERADSLRQLQLRETNMPQSWIIASIKREIIK